MKESYSEDLANHADPELYAADGNVVGVATTGVHAGQPFTQPGRYITKETILEIYDEMATAIQTGHPHQTRLDPPPGPPTNAEGNFIPLSEWDESNWPEHIHPPRETNSSQVRKS